MKRHARWVVLSSLLVIITFVGTAVAQQPKPGGTLRVAWEADVTGLDPHLSNGIQAWHVVGNLFRGPRELAGQQGVVVVRLGTALRGEVTSRKDHQCPHHRQQDDRREDDHVRGRGEAGQDGLRFEVVEQ